jgi:hypothetical protein
MLVRSSPRQRHASSYEGYALYYLVILQATVLHCSYGLIDLTNFLSFYFCLFLSNKELFEKIFIFVFRQPD